MGEELVLAQNLVDDLLRIANEQRAARRTRRVELTTSRRRPATLSPDPRHRLGVRREERVGRLVRVVCKKTVRVDADAEPRRIVSRALAGVAI